MNVAEPSARSRPCYVPRTVVHARALPDVGLCGVRSFSVRVGFSTRVSRINCPECRRLLAARGLKFRGLR